MNIKPENIIVIENQLAIKWNDGKESFVDCKKLSSVSALTAYLLFVVNLTGEL